MKTYEELLSDIEEDIDLMGTSHTVYAGMEDGRITDYDYLPSDSCTISITLKELQESLHQKLLYERASHFAMSTDKTAPKLAVIFPGIGYTVDKPLLYYSIQLARHYGYQIKSISYESLPGNIKGNSEKMKQAFNIAFKQTEQLLKDLDWSSYGEILFISKSIGTVIASAYISKYNLVAKSILFTPLTETFQFSLSGAIVFHGTSDPWAKTPSICTLAEQKEVPVFLIENANHSLETEDILNNLSILRTTMEHVKHFISGE